MNAWDRLRLIIKSINIIPPFHDITQTNHLTVWSTNVNSSRPTALISRQIAQKPSLLLLVPLAQDGQMDHKLFVLVRLSVDLGRTLVDLFIWTDKSSSKNRLHRRTNRRTNSDDKVVKKLVRPVFTSDDLSVQTICSSSSENGH